METASQVLSQALHHSTLAEDLKTVIREHIQLLTMERRIAFAIALKRVSPNRSKINSALEKFLTESGPHTPSLRSGSVRRLAQGEHRMLSMGEDMPFDVSLDPAREGGSSTVRKVLSGNEILALKTFHTNINEESFKREFSILKQLNYVHVGSAFASLQDQAAKFHILLKPWCEVRTGNKVVSNFVVIPSCVY